MKYPSLFSKQDSILTKLVNEMETSNDVEKQQGLVGPSENEVHLGAVDTLQLSKEGEEIPLKSDYVKFLAKYPRIILLCFLLFTIGIAIYGLGVFNVLDSGGWYAKTSESYKTGEYFQQFDNVTDPTGLTVLMSHPTWLVNSTEYRDAYFQLKADLTDNMPVYGYISYFDYDYMTGMISDDNHMALMSAQLPKSVLDWSGANPPYTESDFKKATAGNPLTLTFAGDLLSGIEANKDIDESLAKLEQGAAPVIIVLLIFAFNGITAAMVPILLIIWNVITTFTALRLVTLGFSVSTYVTNVTTIFGAGLAIDYGLFMHLRFSEEMKRNKGVPGFKAVHAVEKMLGTSGRTVFYSALLLCATLSGALQFTEYFLTTMTLSIMFPALFACIGSLSFVPVIYILMGDRIFSLSIEPLEHFLVRSWTSAVGTFQPVSSKVSDAGGSSKNHSNSAVAAINSDDVEKQQQHELGSGDVKKVGTYDALKTGDSSSDGGEDNAAATVDEQKNAQRHNSGESAATDLGYGTAEEPDVDREGVWFRGVSFVMKYPWPFAIVIIGCLAGLMSVFVTEARFAQQSYGNFPLDSPTRYLAETVNDKFPKSNGHSSVDIFVETIAPNGVRDSDFLIALNDLAMQLQNASKVVDVSSMTTIDDATNLTQYLNYYADPYAPQNINFTQQLIDPFHLTDFDRVTKLSVSLSIQTSDLTLGKTVRNIRKLVDNAFYVNGVKVIDRWGVTGEAAYQYDVNKDVIDTIPYAIIVVVISMYLFITLLTGSIVLPLKAIFCAGLSLCASFGALVLVIQNGHGDHLLEFRNNLRCLDPLNLVFIFVVAFGLSLDYEVFILGRVQEIYLQTHDNVYAVAKGIQTSARSVTMAAVLLTATVGGFLAADVLLLKQIGMGIGLTIFMDATVVRLILVPALMSLMGDYNWYAPGPVKKVVEKLNIKH